MAAYLMLFKFTQKGIETVRESPERVEKVMDLVRKLGGETKGFYLLLGRYDTAVFLEAPDDETAAKISLAISSKGYASTETLRGFTLEEFRKIAADLP